MRNILIAGAGQLGSRYLQGFSHVTEPLKLWVFDISELSLGVARARWVECESRIHEVYFHSDYESMPSNFDLAIVSSTANVRTQIVKEILRRAEVKNFILEKVLAQSLIELDELEDLLSNSHGVWVNTPMYMWPLYENLRKYYQGKAIPVEMVVSGFQGLACNAIHYIDYVSRWNKSRPIYVNIDGLNNGWFCAKRQGFYEVDGCLKVYMEDDSVLTLNSDRNNNDYKVSISVNGEIWDVNDKSSIAVAGSCSLTGSIKLQSELVSELYNQIFYSNGPNLPTLGESVVQHKLLLVSLISHWNKVMPTPTSRLQIT
jgi:hypothetical protein